MGHAYEHQHAATRHNNEITTGQGIDVRPTPISVRPKAAMPFGGFPSGCRRVFLTPVFVVPGSLCSAAPRPRLTEVSVRYDLRSVRCLSSELGAFAFVAAFDVRVLRRRGAAIGLDAMKASEHPLARDCLCSAGGRLRLPGHCVCVHVCTRSGPASASQPTETTRVASRSPSRRRIATSSIFCSSASRGCRAARSARDAPRATTRRGLSASSLTGSRGLEDMCKR